MLEIEQQAGPGALIVHDVPLITENGLAGNYDIVVVVDVAPRTQLERLIKQRGMTREQANARIASQATREQRLAVAGFVIDNSGSLTELDRQVGELWAELRRRANAPKE
jgi:dephospho-CoA kinase